MNALLKNSLLSLLFTLPVAGEMAAANASPEVAAEFEAPSPNTGPLRIVPVERTPEPEEVQLSITFPDNGSLKTSLPIKLQIRDEGFPLGVNSEFQRAREIANDPDGQSVHVLIDNNHYFPVYDDWVNALDNDVVYFEQTIEFSIPFDLEPGMHVIRAFPVRTFNESLKADGCFTSSYFYFKEKSNPQGFDLNMPYLTYNQPLGEYKWTADRPILLDFYLTNCRLSTDGYKVKVVINGTTQRIVTRWTPYYIYGLPRGEHKIRLQLLDSQNKVVPGPFNDIEETITIH